MGMLDPLYWIMIAPGFLLALYATFKVKSTFAKYSQVGSSRGYTGAQAAAEMLRREGISGVQIERVSGHLSDHYDPRHRTLRLSEAVFDSRSLSAIGVACHEAGHAIQHARAYAPLALRSTLVPVTNICSTLWIWVMLIGMFAGSLLLAKVAVAMLAVSVVFALVTLPVEWDASARAKHAMMSQGLLAPTELPHAGKVLNAAFLTYLASAVTAILTLLYYLIRLGLLGGRSEE
jgi:Zn-dependent membrane protease YugP